MPPSPWKLKQRLDGLLRTSSLHGNLFPTFVLLAFCASLLHASRTVVDGAGRTVKLPDHVQRIVCLAPSVTDDVFDLGAAAQVVAVSDFTRYPAEATKKPSVGPPGKPIMEQVVSLHPDLAIGTTGINNPETVSLLERQGITVFMVDPVGLPGVYRSLEQIGEAIGRAGEAAKLVAQLRQREAALRTQAARHQPIRAFLPLWYDPVFTIGKHAYLTDLLAVVGLRSVTDDIAQDWPKVSIESVVARDPDVLVLLGDSEKQFGMLRTLPGWSTLRAVSERKILHADDRIELPSPVCFDALEALARQVPAS